jgi:mRNA interferase RelE/StbE
LDSEGAHPSYRVEFRPAPLRELDAIPRHDRARIWERIESLSRTPRPHGVEKLAGYERRYRVRSGDYRVVYEIHDGDSLVVILHVAHRKDVYRRM